jgi:hypothetical protein
VSETDRISVKLTCALAKNLSGNTADFPREYFFYYSFCVLIMENSEDTNLKIAEKKAIIREIIEKN